MNDFDIFEQMQSNIPEYSVSDLSLSLKRMVEDNFSYVRVRGELSRVTVAKSGHMYSSLKDDNAVLDAVCWRGTMSNLSIKPEEGMEVIVTGRLTTYPGRSNYQIVIESMEPAGQGAILKMIEDRRKKLAAEGLFDEGRKKPIPFLPQTIGVVTSPTGAVIRDILHRLEDRFPRHVLLWPVMVQGKGASDQIAAAINGFNAMDEQGPIPRPDVLIVARGGGSFEDLMPFQEENVVRAVAASTIPVISAVGHETDTTLIDYAADLRAPTPTGAAEKAVPVRADLIMEIESKTRRLQAAALKMMSHKNSELRAQMAALPHPKRVLEMASQRYDYASEKLNNTLKNNIKNKEINLHNTAAKLPHPKHNLSLAKQKLESTAARLLPTMTRHINDNDARFKQASRMLETLSFKAVMKRGFAVLRDENNGVITSQKDITERFTIEMHDGKQSAKKS